MPVKFPAGKNPSDILCAQLKKEHGNTFVLKGSELMEVERIPLGVLPFDLATGGGIPRSRMTIFNGPPGSTKSLNLLRAMCTVQAMGQRAVLIQTEHVFDRAWGKRVGLDLDKLIVIQPDNGEQAADAAESFLYASDVGIVGIDSVAMMTPNNTIESDMAKANVGGNAQLMTKMLNKTTVALSRQSRTGHFPALVCINQIRHRIGQHYGNPEKMPGGFLTEFATTLWVRFYGKDKIVKAINAQLPTYKEVSGIIKKYRVPIVHKTFTYDMSILEHAVIYGNDQVDMPVGAVDDSPFAMHCLKALGMIVKDKAGYFVTGFEDRVFKTLDAIKHAYRTEPVFQSDVSHMLAVHMLNNGGAVALVEPTEEQAKELAAEAA